MKLVRYGLIVLTACAVLALFQPLLITAQSPNTSNITEARTLLAALNAWRLELGLSPFAANATLERMAIDQAQYVLSLPQIPAGGAIHTGRTGEDPRTRAVTPLFNYNWRFYGQPVQVVISEIAAAQRNPAGATSFWRKSDIHNRTVSNANYREAGVAAIPYTQGNASGFLYMVVVGGQPNVLPALADVRAGTLYLSNETYTRGQGTWIRNAQQVRIFDELNNPLTDWIPWARQMPLPATTGSFITIVYREGTLETATTVSLLPADVLLPQYANDWGTSIAIAPTQPLIAPTATLPPAQATIAQPTLTPTLTPTFVPAQPTALPQFVPTPTGAFVTLIYDNTTLNIVPGRSGVNIRGLVLTDGTSSIRVGNVNASFIRGTLDALNRNDCIVINVSNNPSPAPTGCTFTSATFLPPNRAVWLRQFTVLRDATIVAVCLPVGNGSCIIPLG
ncbi:MAG: CAP domain-containing protein [Chloroflexota bacterium]|nr:CAP domain-containing protein [Chloroflexota bacterium]